MPQPNSSLQRLNSDAEPKKSMQNPIPLNLGSTSMQHRDESVSPLTYDAPDLEELSDRPAQHKKINFEPPSKKRRSDTLTTVNISAQPNKAKEKLQSRQKAKLSKAETSDLNYTGDGLVCKLTVPLWVKYGKKDLFSESAFISFITRFKLFLY